MVRIPAFLSGTEDVGHPPLRIHLLPLYCYGAAILARAGKTSIVRQKSGNAVIQELDYEKRGARALFLHLEEGR